MAVTALLASAAGVWNWQMTRRVHLMATSGEQLRDELRRLESSPAEPTAVDLSDFTHRLAIEASVDPLVRQFQRSSAQLGVAFVSVANVPHDATAQTLGRIDVSVTLRGNYPNLKTVLAGFLDRVPGLVLQRMTLRRLANPLELEARVDLMLLSRPLPASGVAG